MDKLIIHAGLHKTGTSAIQKALHKNRDYLWSNGYLYPLTKPFEAHHKLASRLINASSLVDGIKDAERTLATFKRYSRGRDVVISSEIFSEAFNPKCFEKLPDIFDEIDIVFYVRQQDELIESAYKQQVKQSRECRAIDEYQPYLWDINAHLTKFSNSIKGANVYALEYNRDVFVDGDLTTDFFDRVLGLQYKEGDVILKSIANPSLSSVACVMLAQVNCLSISDLQKDKIKDMLMDEFPMSEYKQYSLLSNEARLNIKKKSALSNENLRSDFLRSGTFEYKENADRIYVNKKNLHDIISVSEIINKISKSLDFDIHDLATLL